MDMDKTGTAIVAILTAIIGVATVSAIISRNSQTSQILASGGQSFAQILSVALSPVTGGSNMFGNMGFTGFNPLGGLMGGMGGGMGMGGLGIML